MEIGCCMWMRIKKQMHWTRVQREHTMMQSQIHARCARLVAQYVQKHGNIAMSVNINSIFPGTLVSNA